MGTVTVDDEEEDPEEENDDEPFDPRFMEHDIDEDGLTAEGLIYEEFEREFVRQPFLCIFNFNLISHQLRVHQMPISIFSKLKIISPTRLSQRSGTLSQKQILTHGSP